MFDPLTIQENISVAMRILRRELIAEVKNKCEWCNSYLNTNCEIHHLNGCALDFRRENLAILCSDCHSETKGFAKRSKELRLDWSLSVPLTRECIRQVYDNCHPRATFENWDKVRHKEIV